MKNELKAFTNLLRSYRYNEMQIAKLSEKKEQIFYDLTGVKAIRYDKQVSSTNHQIIEERKHELRKQLEELDEQINAFKKINKYIDEKIEQIDDLPTKKAVIEVFVHGKSFEKVGKEFAYSKEGIFKKIKTAVSKIA